MSKALSRSLADKVLADNKDLIDRITEREMHHYGYSIVREIIARALEEIPAEPPRRNPHRRPHHE